MAEDSTRRPNLKRVALWTTAVALLLISYVAGAPFVAFFAQRYLPASEPVFKVLYAPLVYVGQNQQAPGHDLFLNYATWCESTLAQQLD